MTAFQCVRRKRFENKTIVWTQNIYLFLNLSGLVWSGPKRVYLLNALIFSKAEVQTYDDQLDDQNNQQLTWNHEQNKA